MSTSPKNQVSSQIPHSQQDKVPTLRSPADPLVRSQSKDVFERLTVTRASTRHQTPLGMTRGKEKHAKGSGVEDHMEKRVVRSQVRLRMMREKMEEARLQEMREYPKISEKSKELAEKADEKFFSRFNIRPRLNSSGRVQTQKDDESHSGLESSENRPVVTANQPHLASTALKQQMDFLDPDDSAPSMKSGLRERIRQYLQEAPQPKAHPMALPDSAAPPASTLVETLQQPASRSRTCSYNYAAPSDTQTIGNLRIPGRRAVHPSPQKGRLGLGSTLSPVIRQVSYGSGCDWDALLARKKQ